MNDNKNSILIVEDDYFTQKFYSRLFEKINQPVIQSEDGNEILSFLENGNIDLIILDVNLKKSYLNNRKIDGVSLSKFIKSNTKHSGIPILLVSAYNNTSKNNFLENSLADDYITKPITDLNLFLDKVNTLKQNGRR